MSTLISILSNTPDFLVVNKPIGVEMHNAESGICQLLCLQESLEHLYLIHRLDKETSGCLVLAKTKKAASALSKAFRDRTVTKYYLALSDQKPRKKQGKIQGLMKNTRAGSYSLLRDTQNLDIQSPNFALTFFKSELNIENMRTFYLKPITGKTHQLRVALKSIGSPILGDKRYKGKSADRLYLHSYMLNFIYQGKEYSFSCMPESGEYFGKNMFSNFKCPSTLDWPRYKMPHTSLSTVTNTK